MLQTINIYDIALIIMILAIYVINIILSLSSIFIIYLYHFTTRQNSEADRRRAEERAAERRREARLLEAEAQAKCEIDRLERERREEVIVH